MTRIANFHHYQSVSNDLMRQQVKLNENSEQLASGKRVQTSGDDPLASIYIQNFHQQNTQIDQFLEGINLARNRQNRAEIAISESEDLIDSAKRNVMEMINGSLSDSDRRAHQQDLQGLFDNFLDHSNAKDESGNFLFSGTQASKQPFFRDGVGHVRYVGNNDYRLARVSPAISVQTSDPGDAIFMQIENPFGDYQPEYELQEGSLLLLYKAINTDDTDNAAYEISFSADDNGNINYQLTQDAVEVSSGLYDPDKGIEWGTLSLIFEGQMLDGDKITFERQKQFSIFDAFKNGVDLASNAISDASATAELQQVTKQFSQAFNHLNQARSEIGTRLSTLDRQEEIHLDYQVILKRSLSTMEDLDYATAVIDMNENLLALQASQQAFAKTKELSLFNYI